MRSRGSRSSSAPATPARRSRAVARSRRSRSAAASPRVGASSVHGSGDTVGAAGLASTADAPAAGPPVALYVHVPFCVSLCPYCDFVVYAGAAARGPNAMVDAFLPALDAEVALRADALDAAFGAPGSAGRPPLQTLYLGGGTPSLIAPETIGGLVATV